MLPWSRFTLLLLPLLLAGCQVEKQPPSVQWLRPTGHPEWMSGVNAPLRFAMHDPRPESGSTGPAEWRVDIGPESGGLWWSTSGESAAVMDTVNLSWTVPAAPAGSTGSLPLRLTVIVTDGEGQTAADFTSAQFTLLPLASTGIAFATDEAPSAFHLFAPNGSGEGVAIPTELTDIQALCHADGSAIWMVGGQDRVEAWSAPESNAPPQLLWSRQAPFGPQIGGLRFLRRALPGSSGPALISIGWSDRVEWTTPTGSTQQSWLLDADETLLDGAIMDGRMTLLVRTAAGDLSMVRFNLETSARIDAVTWTPEAPGSIGPGGNAWLIEVDGSPTAIEADGTGRLWFTLPDGASGLSTQSLPGSGTVHAAGRFETGISWISRGGWHWLPPEGPPFLANGAEADLIAEDRALSLMWVRFNPGEGGAEWTPCSSSDGAVLSSFAPLSVPGTGRALSVGHNRTGPP